MGFKKQFPINNGQESLTLGRLLTEITIVALVYFLLARLGQILAIHPGNVTPVWPPSGFALAVIMRRGYHVWPGLWLGNFLGNSWAFFDASTMASMARTIATGLAIGPGDVAQALLGAMLIRHFCQNGDPFGRTRDVFIFVGTQMMVCLLSATGGVLALCAGGIAPWDSFGYTWFTWYLGDGLGVILVAPLLLSLTPSPRALRGIGRFAEFTGILVISTLAAWFVFHNHFEASLSFLPLPLVLWAAVRGDQFEVAVTVIVITSIAIWGTYHELGPFAGTHKNVSLLLLQLYSAIMVVTGASVASALRECRRAEKEMEIAKRKAEAAAHTKSRFLANMSHEIRTPLSGIIGLTELLLKTKQTDTQREYQLIVRNSAESLMAILNDILNFSKLESGKLVLDQRPFELSEFLGNTVQSLGLRAAEKGIELSFRIEPEVPENLVGDDGRIQQILVNLIGNAIKFTEQGEVALEVHLESRNKREVVLHFLVRDTGIGISKEKQEMIFESFAQAESSTTRRFGGTGLGLTISRQLVEMMKGRIWVESEAGSGSTFHFLLKLEEGESSGATDEPDRRKLEGKRILVVDDNPTIQKVLGEILDHHGMQSTLCSSGGEAIELVSGQAFDAVILDHQMPGMDGIETARKIHQSPGDAAPPVLMLFSTNTVPEGLDMASVAGHIIKPVKPSSLLSALGILFDSGGDQTLAPGETSGIPLHRRVPLRVLLADDSRVNRLVATRILEEQGYEVTPASNGLEALELVRKKTFEVILMDVQMPEMNGLDATMAIRQMEAEQGGRVPIIAMTANAMSGDREICLEAGMDDYLPKPVRPPELYALLEKYVPARQ